MKYATVCSGIEAPSVAWHALGWEPQWFSEIEPFPSAVLAHRWPDVPNLGDMTKIHEMEVCRRGTVELLVGGTPCQSFSVAGLREGLRDPRGNLALEFLRLAEKLGPRWIVWENVPGVLSSNGGRDFGAIVGALEKLGYGWAYRVLDAQHFGVPQRRRRVFLVGHLGDWRSAAEVLFEPESLRGDSQARRKAREDVAPTLTRSIGGRGPNDGFPLTHETSRALLAARGSRLDGETETFIPEVTGTLTKATARLADQGDRVPNLIAHTLRGGGFDASEDGTGRGTPLIPICFDPTQITHPENRSRCDPGAPAPTLAKEGKAPAVAGGAAVRRLTPRECERLQGFPDDYTAIPWRGKAHEECPDGPRYKAIGNSMAVPVVRWIGERIAKVDALPSGELAPMTGS